MTARLRSYRIPEAALAHFAVVYRDVCDRILASPSLAPWRGIGSPSLVQAGEEAFEGLDAASPLWTPPLMAMDSEGDPISLQGVGRVLLFVPDVDGIASVLEALEDTSRAVVLVGWWPESSAYSQATQTLVRKLSLSFGSRLRWVTAHAENLPAHTPHWGAKLLPLLLAMAMTHTCGLASLAVPRHGIAGLNLWNAYSDCRTLWSHPIRRQRVASWLGKLAGQVIRLSNPLETWTPTELYVRIAEALDLDTLSASLHPCVSQQMCGVCRGCQDHRLALGKPVHASHNLWTAPSEVFPQGSAFWDHLVYALRIGRHRHASAFMADPAVGSQLLLAVTGLGADTEAQVQAILDLHQRYAERLHLQLRKALARHAAAIHRGELPADCVVMRVHAGEEKVGPPTSSAVPSPSSHAVCRSAGDVWYLAWPGEAPFSLRPRVGLVYLQHLLRHPGRSFSALELVALAQGYESPTPSSSLGEEIDAEALASVRSAWSDLQEQFDDAEERNDWGTKERLQSEIEALEDYVRRHTFGGRPRQKSPDRERARKAVLVALKRTYDAIEQCHEEMAEHLRQHIRTGNTVVYEHREWEWDTR